MSRDEPSPPFLAEHTAACERGEKGYFDPESRLFVMTSVFLRERGFCCAHNCRHCPYPPEAQCAAGRDPRAPAWPYP